MIEADTRELDAWEATLAAVDQRFRGDLTRIVDDIADEAVGIAKQLAPVDSGDLQESIEVTKKSGGKFSRSRWIGSKLFYARFQEYGTSRHAPRPFLEPAAEQVAPKFGELVAEAGVDWLS